MKTFLQRNAIFIGIASAFVLWAGAYIWSASFIAVDGLRYFALFDDAMISMRYAWNFSHGHGLVWNAGEYVEGYTNFLMTLFMSVATRVFSKRLAVLAVQVFGVGVLLAIASLSVKISRQLWGPAPTRPHKSLDVLVFAGILAYYPLSYWAIMGMETGVQTLLILAAVAFAFQYRDSHRQGWLVSLSVSLALAYLARPDSLIPGLVIFLYAFGELWDNKKAKPIMVQAAYLIVPFLALLITHQLFRLSYYGEMLPNTYYLKVGGVPVMVRLRNGANFINGFLLESSVLLVIAMAGSISKFTKEKLFLLTLIASIILDQIWVGGDAWAYWRMMVPGIPLAIILLFHALSPWIFSDIRETQPQQLGRLNTTYLKNSFSRIMGSALILICFTLLNARFWPEISMRTLPFLTDLNHTNINKAILLQEITTEQATMGVKRAGIIPYFTGRYSIDFFGKADPYIAHLPPILDLAGTYRNWLYFPGHNKYDADYSIKQLQPTFIEEYHTGDADILAWGSTRYAEVTYQGMSFTLLKDSADVLWDLLQMSNDR
ncbi:MAG: hypothetical protein OEZ02_03865 [Anaerolineae bacterium]|nr:hypothetical protein [Anaerolineae bacterium]